MAVIGRNGAGKSTLLKLLSRITEPTEGAIGINGRIASLLEVGTGFHPELSGRENIYLNGAILGMHRAEIRSKFDEIVAFAEVEQFLDTPVKRYSSGMYVRLAFAVAAHLEPEILIVDEVLAVGDAKFQKKCLGRMEEVSTREGGTVIFVSHNLQAVQALCQQAILIENGKLVTGGPVRDVVGNYLDLFAPKNASLQWNGDDAPGNDQVRVREVTAHTTGRADASGHFSSRDPVLLDLVLDVQQAPERLACRFLIKTREQETIFSSSFLDRPDEEWPAVRVGRNHWRCEIPGAFLNAGSYRVTLLVAESNKYWIARLDDAIEFEIYFDHGQSSLWMEQGSKGDKPVGMIAPILKWTVLSA